jgi:hypothetical protein
MDSADDFQLVADVAIGHERDEAQARRIVREVERRLDALDHLRSARAVEPGKIVTCEPDVPGCCSKRGGAQLRRVFGEANDLERIALLEMVQRNMNRVLGLVQRPAIHRPGTIEHEHHFHGSTSE